MHVFKQLKYFLPSLFLQNLIFPYKLKTPLTSLIKIVSCENTGKKLEKTKFALKMMHQSILKLDSFNVWTTENVKERYEYSINWVKKEKSLKEMHYHHVKNMKYHFLQ